MNVRTREIAEAALESGLSPLEYLLSVVRDESASRSERMDAAKASAPFVHPRLSSIDIHSDGPADPRDLITKEQRDAVAAAYNRSLRSEWEAEQNGLNSINGNRYGSNI